MNAVNSLEDYLVYHDLRPSTATYYRRIVGVYVKSCGDDLNSRKLSEWLGELKSQGKSDYYRRSIKAGIQAVLRFGGDDGKVRPVRCQPLEHEFWSVSDVQKLIDHSPDSYWRTLIGAGWCLGFSQCDLLALRRSNIAEDRSVVTRRSKTGKLVSGVLEEWIVREMPTGDQPWKWQKSLEWFRADFRRIVRAAGLVGTFKQLRRSAAASVEVRHREQAHRFLGNTRQVCEKHYLPASVLATNRLRPESLRSED